MGMLEVLLLPLLVLAAALDAGDDGVEGGVGVGVGGAGEGEVGAELEAAVSMAEAVLVRGGFWG